MRMPVVVTGDFDDTDAVMVRNGSVVSSTQGSSQPLFSQEPTTPVGGDEEPVDVRAKLSQEDVQVRALYDVIKENKEKASLVSFLKSMSMEGSCLAKLAIVVLHKAGKESFGMTLEAAIRDFESVRLPFLSYADIDSRIHKYWLDLLSFYGLWND